MTALALSAPPVDHHAVPAMRLGRWRLTQVSICVAVAALPLLRPAGPGNTGLVDLALLAAMMISALWASTRSHQIQLPYAMAVGLTLAAPIRTKEKLHDPACVKVIFDQRQRAIYFSRAPIPFARTWDDSMLAAEPPMFHQSAARTTFYDVALERHLPRVTQLVILGAGFDTRSYTLPAGAKVRCFEVDEPKIRRSSRNHATW